MRSYFDVHRDDWDGIYRAPAGSLRARINRRFRRAVWGRMALALTECREPADGTVLDVGCGTGELAIRLAERGSARALGIDAANEMVRTARAHAVARGVAERCTFVCADFLTHEFGGERFDTVVALGVLDYVQEAPAFLARMWSLAERRLIVSLPHEVPPRAWLRRAWHGIHGSRLHYYSTTRVRELAAALAPPASATRVHTIAGSDHTDVLVCARPAAAPIGHARAAAPGPVERRWSSTELRALLEGTFP